MKDGDALSIIHNDKDKFRDLVDRTASLTGFYAPLMEKDYYLTLILSRVDKLSKDLIFKGGTCLYKIYGSTLSNSKGVEPSRESTASRGISTHRLSEDLDFSMKLPQYEATRGERRKCIQPIKDKIENFAKSFGFRIDDAEKAGRNESKQYVYYFVYDSVILPSEQTIKFEIGLRFNPILKPEARFVQHKFLHPFTGEPLFDGGKVNCLSLKEIVSEKLRAAALRKTIAPRDFYDLDFILRNKFNLADKQVMDLFKKKIEEDLPTEAKHDKSLAKAGGGNIDLKKYSVNLGRSDSEIKEMRSRIENELFDVLTPGERGHFDLDKALKSINAAMEGLK